MVHIQSAQFPSAPAVISISTVRHLLGVSRSTYYRLTKTPDFPKAIQLTQRRVAIRKSDFDAWLASRKQA